MRGRAALGALAAAAFFLAFGPTALSGCGKKGAPVAPTLAVVAPPEKIEELDKTRAPEVKTEERSSEEKAAEERRKMEPPPPP